MQEVWKDIKGYEGHYQISNIGRVKSLARMRFGKGGYLSPLKERILKQKTTKSGYKSVHLRCMDYQSYPTIHRIVAEAFIDNPDNKPTVNHIDANKENNHVDNLEWSTHSEQMIHAVDNELLEVRGSPKYSKEFKQEVLNFYNSNEISICSLSKLFCISERTAGRIVNGGVKPRTTTRILSDGSIFVENILSKEQVKEIKQMRADGMTLSAIAKLFNRGTSQIHRISRGESRITEIE